MQEVYKCLVITPRRIVGAQKPILKNFIPLRLELLGIDLSLIEP